MHTLIEKLFKKKGIKSIDDLSPEEKADFDRWQGVLSNEPVTLEKFNEFLSLQKNLIETQMGNLDNSLEKNTRLVLLHTVYSKLLKVSVADKTEREALEKYLTSLVDSKDT